jgi:hypothetical protein
VSLSKLRALMLDPLLLELSLRENLDPEGLHSDVEIWDALEKSHVSRYTESWLTVAQSPCRNATGEARRDDVW